MRGLGMDNRLEAIAGKPAGMLTATGNVALSGFGQYGDRTLYYVCNVTGSPIGDGSPIMADIGSSQGNGTVRFLAATTQIRAIGSTKNGAILGSLYSANLSPGRYALSAWIGNGATTFGMQVLGGSPQTQSINAGDGLESGPTLRMPVLAAGVNASSIRVCAYPAAHNTYQRTAIMAKLLQMSA